MREVAEEVASMGEMPKDDCKVWVPKSAALRAFSSPVNHQLFDGGESSSGVPSRLCGFCLTRALSTVHHPRAPPHWRPHLLVGLTSHSPSNRELTGLASQPLSNRNKKLGAGHRGERNFDGEGRLRGRAKWRGS
ncbi:hypothetical protein TIFTF001_013398 [Ficus carica]|uniref:Uncharacterized protein n=1 Tax=Ficus carica TaxID=3494 RepID=A0AA88A3G4_FICCA|nr:hypothetical protein TIFTF001_013398 [Ficus carica]